MSITVEKQAWLGGRGLPGEGERAGPGAGERRPRQGIQVHPQGTPGLILPAHLVSKEQFTWW